MSRTSQDPVRSRQTSTDVVACACSGAAAHAAGCRRPPLWGVAVALAAGAALLCAALGLCAQTALAAPPTTSGFIVAAPGSGAIRGSQAIQGSPANAPDALGSRLGVSLPDGIAPDGRAALTVDAGAPFDMLGIVFRSTPAGARDVVFHVRVSADRLTWTRWFSVKADVDSGPAGSAFSKADLVTEPVWVGAARYVQYQTDGGAPVSDVRLACVQAAVGEPADAASAASPAASSSDAASASPVAASPVVPAAATAPAPLGMPAEPKIVTRAQWGADESLRSGGVSYGQVRCAFVHHTVNGNTYSRSQAPALVRGIYYYHTRVNGWRDIGYNFLIDRFGTIYEGRYGGVTKAVIGAQVLGFNSMSTGVALIGTFDSVAPSKAALSSLEHLLAWKLDLSHLNPLGTARALCQTTQKYRAGQWVSLPVISGHRQVNYTDCPGTVLFGMLPGIRTAVAGIGDPKIYTPTASPAAFSPNGDGVRDTVRLHGGLSDSAAWTIVVTNASGTVVARFSGTGPAAAATWDGHDTSGNRAPDGTYTASFAASDDNGTARPASTTVRIDTLSPQITGLAATPTVVSPNGDRFADSAAVGFSLSETSSVGLTVLDAKGTVVRTLPAISEASGSRRLVWDGKIGTASALTVAPDGTYQLVLRATDAAGNHSSAHVAVTVDDTIGHPHLSPIWLSPNGDGTHDAGVLGFRTTRGARLSVAIARSGGAVVRRASLGSLASGTQSWTWDGLDTAGAVVADGTYRCTLTAVNAIGTVAVTLTWHVDTAPPSAAWRTAPVTIKLGKTVHVSYRVTDALSPRAMVAIVARSAAGAEVAWSSPTVKTAATMSWSFTPKARGTYTVRVRATDLAGNVQATPAALTVKVT